MADGVAAMPDAPLDASAEQSRIPFEADATAGYVP